MMSREERIGRVVLDLVALIVGDEPAAPEAAKDR